MERRVRGVVRCGPGGSELWLANLPVGRDSEPTGESPSLGRDGRPLVGRRVVGWADLAALPLLREAHLPEGAELAA